jgi:hypothetical protein
VKGTSGGVGVWASGKPAGHFEGDVQVTGHIIGPGGDLEHRISALEQQVATLIATLEGHVHTYKLPLEEPMFFGGPISMLPHLIESAPDARIKLYQKWPPGPPPPPPIYPDPVTGPPGKPDTTSTS